MKHRNGTEYALCPKVATEEMVKKGCDEHICEQGDPWYGAPELEHGDCENIYTAMLSAAPAYEISDQDVERVALALDHNDHRSFKEMARAAIRAFLGDE